MEVSQRKSVLVIILNYVIMVLIWGSFPVAARIGVQHAPPLLLSGMRFSLAFMLMAIVILAQGKKLRMKAGEHWRVFLIALFMVGVLTIMWSTTPIFTALFAMRDAGEVRGWKLLVSLLVGLSGVVTVLMDRLPFLPGSALNFASKGTALIWEIAVLASASIYGFGIRMAKRNGPNVPVMVMTTWQLFYCGVFLLAMSLLFERGYPFAPT